MRAPVTGLVSEGLLGAGPVAAELAMGVLYALSVLCWWRVASRLGPGPGLVLALLLLAYPSYALLFHRLASDALFAAAFALSALLLARLVEAPSAARAGAVGAAVALLVLVRPAGQVVLVLAPLLLLGRGPWRLRAGRLVAFAGAALLPLAVWAGHNAVRADDLTVVRGAGQGLPLFRAFVVDRIVEPGNGAASRELARAVQHDLLPREPYRSYGIDLDEFFTSGSARMHEDLIGLSDRTWGWDDDYRVLARVGREAVLAHPRAYARGVSRDVWRLLWWPLFLPVPSSQETGNTSPEPAGDDTGSGLPTPTEGQPIPSASVSAFISTPDGRFREVWTSPTEHEIVADDAADARHLDRLNVRVAELMEAFPDRTANATLGHRLDQASRWFPRPVVWLLVALAALLVRRPRAIATPLVLTSAALLVLLTTSLAVPATAEYSVPVAPAFLLLAVCGLFGRRRTP